MTREEQIFSAADAAYDLKPYETEQETIAFQDGFTKGVDWKANHPDWHRWPYDKPSEDGDYLCYLNGGFYVVCRFKFGRWTNVLGKSSIIGFMELPVSPKFD